MLQVDSHLDGIFHTINADSREVYWKARNDRDEVRKCPAARLFE